MNTSRLKDLLQAAVELELSTIPAYLCALYSLRPGANKEARLIIRSVIVEEMLHLVLAANVLNAIGGEPRVAGADHVPRYPHELPDGVVLDLLPFSPEAVEAFLKVENPQYDHHALGSDHPLLAGRRRERNPARAATLVPRPTTIGGFYAEIVDGLKRAAATIGEQALFCGDPARQVTRDYYYAGGGTPICVTDLASACKALDEIVEQGEGDIGSMYDDAGDLAHYFRFQQIACDRSYLPSDDAGAPTGPPIGVDFAAVYPMAANPHRDEYADPGLRGASDAANRTWSELLRQVDAAFNGRPRALLTAVPAMFRLRDKALVLLANPMPGDGGRHAGPTFEWNPTDGLLPGQHQEEGSPVIFPRGATTRTDPEAASGVLYDAVIVGGGIAGSIIANQLGRAGQRVLILEAGPAEDLTIRGYEDYLSRFYSAVAKDNQAPYPPNPNAPMPRSTDARRIRPGRPDASAYLVQTGPYCTDTTYTRVLGGTTMHWEAKTLRMLPEDFDMASRFGQGLDWPISYEDLEPYYREAEREIGVSADVEDQAYLGITFPRRYVFPMQGLPLSYLDKMVARGVDGTEVDLGGERYLLKVRSFPQGRNGIPNPDYDGGNGFVPVGAVSTYQVQEGGRCQGNNNCVPLCPVQAKYNAGRTLAKALSSGRVDLLAQAVAYKVHIDAENGRVSHIEYRAYRDPCSAEYTTGRARGRIFVLSANAIENPRLMLASGLKSTSGLMGRNLMDHAYLLSWALLPEVAGTMRGTNCTGGIVDLRGGSFRRQQAGISIDIHNDGWGWATGAPYTDLQNIVDAQNKFGPALRQALVSQISRQLQLAFMIEVPPSPSNRVSVDPAYKDQLGNMRPVISYSVPDYTMRGAAFGRRLARRIFQRLGAEDYTTYDPADYGYVTYEGHGYCIRGGNHLAGTHIMGTSPANSVVDSTLRSWDHRNLYLAGGGSMPTIGTANVTLTLAALCFRSATHMIDQLREETAPLAVSVR